MINITPADKMFYVSWYNSWNSRQGYFQMDHMYKNNFINSFWLEKNEIKDNAQYLNEFLKHKDNVITDKDRVYFTKTSTIPRYKIKEYLDVNKINLNKTNRIAYGDTHVIGFNAMKDILFSNKKIYYSSKYKIPIEALLKFDLDQDVKEFIKLYPTVEYALLQEPYHYSSLTHPFDLSQFESYEYSLIGPSHGDSKVIDNIELFNYYVNIGLDNIKLVFDETLLEACNKGTIIDKDVYENIKAMLNSNDRSNHELAIEIISNSDYIESKFYILFLLCSYWKYPLAGVTKTTNFISCLKYFEKYKVFYQHGWQKLTSELYTKECKTEKEHEIVKQFILEKINAGLTYKGSSFKIKNIEI